MQHPAMYQELLGKYESCIITTDMPNPIFKGERTFTVSSSDNTYQIDLKKGEEVLIYPQGVPQNFVISLIMKSSKNCFGLKIVQSNT